MEVRADLPETTSFVAAWEATSYFGARTCSEQDNLGLDTVAVSHVPAASYFGDKMHDVEQTMSTTTSKEIV